MRKRRAVSPIIAAILLIGLAVIAGAAIFVLVLPMLNPTAKASDITASMSNKADNGTNNQVTFTVTVKNTGLNSIDISVPTSGAVTIGTWAVTSYTANTGGTDLKASTFSLKSGQTADIVFVATGNGNPTGTPSIVVLVHLGSPINADNTFTFNGEF